MKRIIGVLLLFVFASADAALISRAGGAAYYDEVLDITWLADANYARTSVFDFDGRMNWDASQTWISTLNTANHLGVNNWRLPTVTDTGTSGCVFAFSGTDCGFNVDTSTGEMASLFYDTLGNLASFDPSGSSPVSGSGLVNAGPFANLQSTRYWSDTEYAPVTASAWDFNFNDGAQNFATKNLSHYAWAVRSGDIAAVPVPAAVWLFGSALAGLAGLRRVRRRPSLAL